MPTVAEIDAKIAELQKQRAELEEAERKAALAGNAKRAASLLAAMKAAYAELESIFPETFADEKFAALAVSQAWPRDKKFQRAADLSETEIHEARERGKAAIAGIK